MSSGIKIGRWGRLKWGVKGTFYKVMKVVYSKGIIKVNVPAFCSSGPYSGRDGVVGNDGSDARGESIRVNAEHISGGGVITGKCKSIGIPVIAAAKKGRIPFCQK